MADKGTFVAVMMERIQERKGLKNMPKVSVVIPVYNVEKYLRECLDSVIGQTLRDIEIICVDDGSTDSSPDILQEYAQIDSRITVLTQENQYAGAARNNGLKCAKGEYIAFLDSDDFFDADMLRNLYNRARAYQADICFCKFTLFWQNDKRIEKSIQGYNTNICPKNKDVFSREDIDNRIFQLSSPVPWNKLFRHEFILENHLQFQKIRTSNDIAFVMTALALAKRITGVDQRLGFHRKGIPTSLQATKNKEPLLFSEAHRCLKDNLKDRGVYDEVQLSFSEYIISSGLYYLQSSSDPDDHKMVYQHLQNLEFRELDANLLKEEQMCNKARYAEYLSISTLSWSEYVKAKRLFLPKNNDFYYEELQRVYASKSFRIGRFITFIPRKIRGAIRCYREHGMKYTLRRINEKMTGLFGVKL